MKIIEAKDLGKKYKRYPVRWKRMLEWLTRNKYKSHEELWVLRDINFSISPGEAVGIIGQNGAGKSTLLKIMTGTTQPTQGEYHVRGRVSALLELGMGFHPDFTGRQNAYTSGQILGIDNQEITRLMPEIGAFAEIGDYIDQPTRTYSSGMLVRLAFAVATVVRPEVLIVDEALSVGDAYFQHKCFDRIRKFKEEGTTLLFVSHDPSAVKSLCDRAILLDKGRLVREGTPEEILDYYNAVIAKASTEYKIKQSRGDSKGVVTRSGNELVTISNVKLLLNGKDATAVQVGEIVQIVVEFEAQQNVLNPTIGILLKDRLANHIFGTNTYHLGLNIGMCRAGEKRRVVFSVKLNLGPGHYSLTVAAHAEYSHLQGNYDWWDHAATFQMIRGKEEFFTGVCRLDTEVSIL
ncbi:ABC transporter ATP-binding protein [Desulforamulus ruminis]|uniref:ABC transporter related protein n=1 Tax=Desulforamulus ruminis (strain ATCC 23193 / DSM 2154 / NCIMB 8452 / DL) TaxID=696281 RepID=F6DP40_DESRL|nr:ABC transporter ATP-binding protein [Desulforamulus ruminis]AEG61869.1 ABC transporter related protein [Desulforamulus ruminis DSM 2154]